MAPGDADQAGLFDFELGRDGERAGELIDRLGDLADMGFHTAIGMVPDIGRVTPLEIIGERIIPAVTPLGN